MRAAIRTDSSEHGLHLPVRDQETAETRFNRPEPELIVLLGNVYARAQEKDHNTSAHLITEFVERQWQRERPDQVDALLTLVDLGRVTAYELTSLLITTTPLKSHSRKRFFDVARSRLISELGVEQADQITRHLG